MKRENYIFLPDLEKKIEEATHDAIFFFNKKCPYCGKELFDGHIRNKIHLDHFIPISKGGQNVPWNILPVCNKCNSKKNAKNPKLFLDEETFKKCEEYLRTVSAKYVGQTQTDLENYYQIKALLISDISKNNLAIIGKSIVQIVLGKDYDFDSKIKNNTKEIDVVIKYIKKSSSCKESMTATEIVLELYKLTGEKFSPIKIGKILTKMGFEQKTVRDYKSQMPIKKWLTKI